MKKRLNNKGFTLIETVITFAIVAVVGGMFILGFSNVIHLMTDAELIKNDTNELYSDVLSDTDVNVQDQKVKLKIDGQDYEEAVKVSSKTINDGSTVIKLSKFASNSHVTWVPSDLDEEDTGGQEPENPDIPENTIQIHFSLLDITKDGNYPRKANISNTDLVGSYVNNKYEVKRYTIELPQSSGFSLTNSIILDPENVNRALNSNSYLATEMAKKEYEYENFTKLEKYFGLSWGQKCGWFTLSRVSETQYSIIGFKTQSFNDGNRLILHGCDGNIIYNDNIPYNENDENKAKWDEINQVIDKYTKYLYLQDGKIYDKKDIKTILTQESWRKFVFIALD